MISYINAPFAAKSNRELVTNNEDGMRVHGSLDQIERVLIGHPFVNDKADMLERYALDFAGELGSKGIEYLLRHMGSDKKLIHAFSVFRPDFDESECVIDEIVQWFNDHQ